MCSNVVPEREGEREEERAGQQEGKEEMEDTTFPCRHHSPSGFFCPRKLWEMGFGGQGTRAHFFECSQYSVGQNYPIL